MPPGRPAPEHLCGCGHRREWHAAPGVFYGECRAKGCACAEYQPDSTEVR